MRVKDILTGNILDSNDETVKKSWEAYPERYVLPKRKDGELGESELNVNEGFVKNATNVGTQKK
jgi:hypothetical protein